MPKKIAIIVLSFFLLAGCTHTTNNKKQAKENNRKVPKLTLTSLKGKEVNLRKINEPAVINSWAGWCAFCKKELKNFAKAQEKFEGKVRIIAINRSEPKQKAKRYTDNLGVTDKLTFLLDSNDKFYRKIGGFAMPETIFIDKDGNIVFHKRGPMNFETIKQKINQQLLNK
ncbi:MAG: TlpA family protein disulfide reductase [Candidatus Magasanikbacteria bacterium]